MRDDIAVVDEAAERVGEGALRADANPVRVQWVEAAYHDYAGELWAVLYANTCDRELARDATQEAFLRLQFQEPRTIRDVRAWLIRVGRNWMRDQRRKAKRLVPTESDCSEVADGHGDPLWDVLNEEQREFVRAGLASLREDDRKVLVLRYALDWSSARIAETMGTRATAIDMRISRARKRVAEYLRGKEVDVSELGD